MSVLLRLKAIANNPNVTVLEMCELISFHWSATDGIITTPRVIYNTQELETIFQVFDKFKRSYQ